MSTDTLKSHEIRQKLDDELNAETLEDHPDGVTGGALEFFQQLFVEQLNFDVVTDPAGSTPYGQRISTNNWSQNSRAEDAYIIAEAYSFRVVYIELEKLTRTAQRHAVRSMRSEGWAREGEFIAVFHAEDSEIWHLVSPYVEEGQELGDGRTVLRRYIVGEGETHRTVSRNLATMDASRPEPLYERINDAFRLQPVTEKFYEEYKEVRNAIDTHLRDQDLEIEEAKRYSHLLLNRLMFLYFLQKKAWIADDKSFVRSFVEDYEESDDEGCFHEKWLDSLFFEAMNQPQDSDISSEFPANVQRALKEIPFLNGGLFERKSVDKEVDEKNAHIPDDVLIQETVRDFLETYNFTVTEESPFDRDVAVDPAMLGKIYESLIAEEERDEAGIFYTPRVEVDLMCRLALYDHFVTEANDPGEEGKEEIVDFLFTSPEEWAARDDDDPEPILDLIHDVDIVDPACGSGAFLVGMMQVINELYRKLGKEPTYELKEQIVSENLNGVDIKDWAVRVAEFRLWLSLVESEEQIPDSEPVLPNFSFKLHVGDSIVQKVGDEFISLDRIARHASGEIQDRLDELEQLKERYFQGESELHEEINKKQEELLRSHIEQRIEDLEDKKSKAGQRDLNGDLTEEAQREIQEFEAEIESLQNTAENLERADEEGDFLWDLDFPEVMLNGGFDVVIGNPPYVRNENIINQGLDRERLDVLPEEQVEELKDQYSRDLEEYVDRNFDIDAGGQTDLYLYFYFKAIEILRPSGTLSFITSNSWLDTEFGAAIQELLLKQATPRYILDNIAERSFEDPDINTVITLAHKKSNPSLGDESNFVSINVPFDSLSKESYKNLLLERGVTSDLQIQEESGRVRLTDEFRRISLTTDALWRLGGEATQQIEANGNGATEFVYSERTGITSNQTGIQTFGSNDTSEAILPKGEYDGEKWGQFIHAPDAFFQVLRAGEDNLQLLDDLGDVDSGINTRANRFFYLYEVPEDQWEGLEIENYEGNRFPENCRVVRSEVGTWKARGCQPPIEDTYWLIEEEYLRPVIQSPRQSMSIEFDVDEIDTLILSVYEDWPDLEGTYVRDYIEHAKSSKKVTRKSNGEEVEALKVNKRPELSKRKQRMDDGSNAVWWYEILDKNYSRILLPKSCGYSFRTMLSTELVPVDNNLYCFVFDDDPSEKELIGLTLYLNSTIVALLRELYGRSNLGQGGLKTEGVDWKRMPCPDKATLVEIAEEFEERDDLFEREIEKVWDEVEKEDKQQLDKIVFEKIGASPDIVEELQKRTVELVRQRKERAESV